MRPPPHDGKDVRASGAPGAREFYKISNGLRAIPWANAASARVSIVPTYQSS
jgi:hypothetical protein